MCLTKIDNCIEFINNIFKKLEQKYDFNKKNEEYVNSDSAIIEINETTPILNESIIADDNDDNCDNHNDEEIIINKINLDNVNIEKIKEIEEKKIKDIKNKNIEDEFILID